MAVRLAERKKEIAVGVVVVLALVFLVYRLRGNSPLPSSANFVCVATGKMFSIDRDDIRQVPLTNPDSGERTLVPCYERDGKLYVRSHYRGAVQRLSDVNQYVDPESLEVRTSP
ncbi:MAG: hypothetical protein KKB50_20155 [Planctomycetes bacterium]|nr:hypothetical protein [Planctomycetota bacterium]